MKSGLIIGQKSDRVNEFTQSFQIPDAETITGAHFVIRFRRPSPPEAAPAEFFRLIRTCRDLPSVQELPPPERRKVHQPDFLVECGNLPADG